jgi:arabinogalactan endo-1,4-beta-galactosidase
MKTKMVKLFALIALGGMMSCELQIPSYPANNEGTTEGLGGSKRPPVLTDYSPAGMEPLTDPIPDDFIRGVDISNCYIIEQAGGVYYDDDNTSGDIIEILKNHGVNWVRLRLWHNHKLAQNPGPYNGDGDNDLVKTKAIARRAKAANMKFLLNFHYSDNWADPGRQQIPAAWSEFTVDQLVQAVYDYTFDTILELKAAGAEPDMVQIGNEITPGMLSPTIGSNAANLARVLNSGAQAVRLAAPNAKIMLHLDSGGDVSKYNNWFDRFAAHDGTPATAAEVDFDVIGLSWYPYYSSHKSIDDLDTNIRNIRSRYNKEAVVAEHGWAWTIAYDGDELSNLFHITQENQTAAQMTDARGYVTASGIAFETRANGTKYLPASPENQAKVMRAVMDAAITSGGGGVFWWAADWIPASGLRSNWDNQTLFDFYGKALPALSVLGKLQSTAGSMPPPKPKNLRKTAAGYDTVNLAWDRAGLVDQYGLERSPAGGNNWTAVSETIGGLAYTDTGLAPGTSYDYRVRGQNTHGWGTYSDVLNAATNPLIAPSGLRISATSSSSITLAWNNLAEATSGYTIYHAGPSATEPAAENYSLLTSPASGDTGYQHTGLSDSETHWYKISAVYGGSLGEGPKSIAVSGVTGSIASPDYKAVVNMATGTLDADFTDSSKAESSADSLTQGGSPLNWDVDTLYVANDATNLYIALDFDANQPVCWGNDFFVVVIDNTNSTNGGADTNSLPIASDQAFTGSPSIEGYVSLKINNGGSANNANIAATLSPGGAGTNAEYWDVDGSWYCSPVQLNAAAVKVIKFSIPLSSIDATAGNNLRVFAAFSKSWETGDLIPANAAAGGTAAIDMSQALAYTIK